MKKPIIISIILILSLILILGSILVMNGNSGFNQDTKNYQDGDERPTLAPIPDFAESTAKAHGRIARSSNPNDNTHPQLSSGIELISQFMTSPDAGRAQTVIDEIRVNGNIALANDLELEIRGRCGFLDGVEPPYERTRWAHELILKYCSNYIPSVDQSGKVPISITKSLALTNLRKKLLELDTGEFDQYFMEFLASTNSMQELMAAKFVAQDLQGSGAPLSFGMTDERMVTPAESKLILDTAFELYGCVRFGGCEQNDFRVLEYCVLTGNCERGWNMFDIYSFTMAPNVYEQVSSVLDNMITAGQGENGLPRL